MTRILLRMETTTDLAPQSAIPGITVRPWQPGPDHARIPRIYAAAFGRDPWPDDWDCFDEFDPNGVFVADATDGPAGFVISFAREDFGYISVVAVAPEYRRRGIASALVAAAADYLAGLELATVRIDAYEDSPAAVATYRSLGFEVYDLCEDPDAEPRGTAEE